MTCFHDILLQELWLDDTMIAGTIPTSWRLPSTLKALFLSQNNINGSIPMLPAGLDQLALHNNKLVGGLPDTSVLPASLRHLQVRGLCMQPVPAVK